jgi:hypothetical protein
MKALSMKSIITFLFICFLFSACDNDQRREVMASIPEEETEENYPLLIEGGTKLVYQLGQMTADKGLKLYYDTMPYPAEWLHLPDSIKLQLSVQEADMEP